MTIRVTVIEHSEALGGAPPLVTILARYPKFIHGEAKTHRLMRVADRAYEFLGEVGLMDDPNLSRNASSSRAIPVERLIRDVLEDPVIPMHWGRNQPGMSADEECDERVAGPDGFGYVKDFEREAAWLRARDYAVEMARAFAAAGYHKQIVNRLIEPWCHINVVITATQWSNFFALRRHPAAQPEMRALADEAYRVIQASTPRLLRPGEWHLPFVTDDERRTADAMSDAGYADTIVMLRKLSVARCARTSYLAHDGTPPARDNDVELHDRLVGAVPLHASPAEHQATPDRSIGTGDWTHSRAGEVLWAKPRLHGNFTGWCQYRKMLAGECQ